MTTETLRELRECTSEKSRLADKIDKLFQGDKGNSSADEGRKKGSANSKVSQSKN